MQHVLFKFLSPACLEVLGVEDAPEEPARAPRRVLTEEERVLKRVAVVLGEEKRARRRVTARRRPVAGAGRATAALEAEAVEEVADGGADKGSDGSDSVRCAIGIGSDVESDSTMVFHVYKVMIFILKSS